MARPPHRRRGPHRLHGVGRTPPRPDAPDEPQLLLSVRDALRSSRPLPLLALASSILSASDPRFRSPLEDLHEPDDDRPSLSTLIDSFLEVRVPETSSLLGAIAELTDDEVMTQRIRRELDQRPHKPPRWLRRLTPVRIERAVEMTHVLGDGDNVVIGVTTAADDQLAVVIYIDHNLGTVVKDAFVVDETVEALIERFGELSADEPGASFGDLDLADARTRVRDAIDLGATYWPPLETDTWPACRPLVEWVLGHLPEGGTGYERPQWSEQDVDELTERFLTSEHGEAHADDDARDLLHGMFWFARDYGPGDPLRWSPVSVEILLTDFLARKVLLPPEVMRRAPAVLRDLIRFAHEERAIDPRLTEQTLRSVNEYRDQYLGQVDEHRPESDALRSIADVADLLGPGASLGFGDDHLDYDEMMLEHLRDQVGGEDALATLDTQPLPDEPLDLSRVDEDVHERVRGIADLTDRACDELLDTEHRTACRRLLADVAAGDPQIFRRRSKDETAAAAIAWVIARVNGAIGHGGALTAKELIEWFGVRGSVSQRAEPMLRAIGIGRFASYDLRLASPRYLVGEERARIIARRDRYGG